MAAHPFGFGIFIPHGLPSDFFSEKAKTIRIMNISVEISMYPLTKNYEPPIIDFIEKLNEHSNIKVLTNTMSTQIFGDYEEVMKILTPEIKAAFLAEPTTIMVMKLINSDLTP